jgi:hypothetical protein
MKTTIHIGGEHIVAGCSIRLDFLPVHLLNNKLYDIDPSLNIQGKNNT